MFSSVVVKNVSTTRKELHYVKLISKIHHCKFFSIVAETFFTTTLLNIQRCIFTD